MKPTSNSAHKKNQSVGGPAQLQSMATVQQTIGGVSTNTVVRQSAMTPDRNLQGIGFQGQPQGSSQVKLANQKANTSIDKPLGGTQIVVPQKQKQLANS